jgi:hypothetical protein
MGGCGDEVGAGSGGTARDRHCLIVNCDSDAEGCFVKSGPQRLKRLRKKVPSETKGVPQGLKPHCK